MKKLVSAILALLLAVIMVGGGVLPPAAPVAATGVQVSLSAPANVLLGSNFTATVNITNVVDLNGAQYEIVVDPAVLVVDNVTAGQIGATVIPVQGFTMVSPGRYLVLQSLMFDTVNGTGYLAVVHLRAVGSAGSSSAINLANGILSGWTAEIPATWVGGSVNIYQVATQLASITVTPINPSVAAGLTQQFTATGNYTDAHTADITNTVAWASSDTAVATINATSGLATGKAVGTTVITATSGNISGSTTLTVTAAELVFMQVMPGWQQIPLGLAQQYSAIGFYTDGSTVNMTSLVDWVSSNTSVATVGLHTGLAKTLAQGTTWISATLGNAYGGSELDVLPPVLLSIAVTPPFASIPAGLKQQYTATGTYTNNTTANITGSVIWSSSDTNVATINATSGLAASLNVGSTVITATSGAISGSTTLTVTAPVLLSIVVAPAAATVGLGQTQQFTATGTYTNGTADITTSVSWSSSNPSVATINNAGVATAKAAGTTLITASLGGIVSPPATLTVVVPTTVEVNNGNTITLGPGQVITGSSTGGIPVDVKNVVTAAEGLAAFDFTLNWNPAVIRVDRVRASLAASDLGWAFTIGAINNTTGTVSFVGTTTQQPYSKANITLAYLGITATGNVGDNTTITVTIKNLVDNALQEITPRSPVNAPVVLGVNLVAETGISQSVNATSGVSMVKVNINRIKNSADNSTASMLIGSYTATVSSNASSSIQFLAVNGVSPYGNPTFDNVTGIFSLATVSAPTQANNTTVANVVPILTGNATTRVSLILAFQYIGSADQPGLSVPEEHANSINLLRGDADNSGVISVTDSLALKQYLVGQLTLSQINPINAASPNHDGTAGDKITITDALAIEQFLVKQLNAYFK